MSKFILQGILRVRLHGNDSISVEAADRKIQGLGFCAFLRRAWNGTVYIDDQGYAVVETNNTRLTQFYLMNQSIVSKIRH